MTPATKRQVLQERNHTLAAHAVLRITAHNEHRHLGRAYNKWSNEAGHDLMVAAQPGRLGHRARVVYINNALESLTTEAEQAFESFTRDSLPEVSRRPGAGVDLTTEANDIGGGLNPSYYEGLAEEEEEETMPSPAQNPTAPLTENKPQQYLSPMSQLLAQYSSPQGMSPSFLDRTRPAGDVSISSPISPSTLVEKYGDGAELLGSAAPTKNRQTFQPGVSEALGGGISNQPQEHSGLQSGAAGRGLDKSETQKKSPKSVPAGTSSSSSSRPPKSQWDSEKVEDGSWRVQLDALESIRLAKEAMLRDRSYANASSSLPDAAHSGSDNGETREVNLAMRCKTLEALVSAGNLSELCCR
jgi:hypothetical protein